MQLLWQTVVYFLMPYRTEAVSLCMETVEFRLVFSAVGKYINGNALKGKLLSIWGNELIDFPAQKGEYTTLPPFSVNMKTGNRATAASVQS